MKQLNRILLLSLLAATFAACSDDNGPKKTVEYDVISFEPAEAMADAAGKPVVLRDVTIVGDFAGGSFKNVLCGKEYMTEEDDNGAYFDGILFSTADGKIGFGSYFSDMAKKGVYDTWAGFALSKNYSQTPTTDGFADYKGSHFSAWTRSGANGTATFVLGYVDSYGAYDYKMPKIKLRQARQMGYLYMANATLAGQWFSTRPDFWLKVSVTGYLGGQPGKTVEQVLVNGKSITSDWVKVDCSSLGEVDELRFDVTSNDMSGGFLNCPSYFCIDEIAFVKQ